MRPARSTTTTSSRSRTRAAKPRYVLVSGNYMSGISVVDFSDPANAREIAYADPPAFPDGFEGGDWSTYWYNGRIYESDLVWGLLVWRLDDPAVATLLPDAPSRTRSRSCSPSTRRLRSLTCSLRAAAAPAAALRFVACSV